MNDNRISSDRFMRLPEVRRECALSTSTIYRRMEAGTFPKAVAIGEHSVAWWESDIAAWKAAPLEWRKAA
jgi:prophage regulatory protein